MHSIPWLADLQDLSGGEMAFLALAVIIVCLLSGFVIDLIMRDSGLGPIADGVLALVAVCAGIYLRYRLFWAYRGDDLYLTAGLAIGTMFVLFLVIGMVKSRIF